MSHPSVLPINQLPYVELQHRGWTVDLVVPRNWKHEYSTKPILPQSHSELTGEFRAMRVALPGRAQRHFYIGSPKIHLRRLQPEVLIIEQEPFSAAAIQWGVAARRQGIPFVIQAAENRERPLPWPVERTRSWVLHHASLVMARSPRAATLARSWGAVCDVRLIPHHVANWHPEPRQPVDRFRVGFAGRLVSEKGLDVLVEAVNLLDPPAELVVAGDGPLKQWMTRQHLPGGLTLLTDISHDDMPTAYARMDVLVLPSRSTTTWSEQFGRVLVEALTCGLPVVGAASGEIPWVISSTRGGLVFPEGDASALARLLSRMRSVPAFRSALARRGQRRARELFSVTAVADALDDGLRAIIANAAPRAGAHRHALANDRHVLIAESAAQARSASESPSPRVRPREGMCRDPEKPTL